MSPPVNRRAEPRVALQVEVTLSSEHNFFTGLTHDLSGGGLFVATHQVLPIGERVRLTFTLPDVEEPIEALTEVRWVRGTELSGRGVEPGIGLRFLQMLPKAKNAVKAFLERRDSIFLDLD
jgi:uncharacterized protein (TIGR02266 family)